MINDSGNGFGVGASYSLNSITVAVAYEKDPADNKYTVATAGGAFGGANVALAVGKSETATGTETQIALKGDYTMASGVKVLGFAKKEDDGTAMGLGMSYDLGGGAAIDAGYTKSAAGDNIISAGVFFGF